MNTITATPTNKRWEIMATTWSLVLTGALLALPTGCGDDRDPTDNKTLYHCSTNTDCLDGFECVCNWCQEPGSTWGCDGTGQDAKSPADTTDTANADTQSKTDAGTVNKDTASGADTSLPLNCNLLTWEPCPSGYGCYFDNEKEMVFCQKHGDKTKGQPCTHGEFPQCGLDGTTPMLCDTVLLKCLPLCDKAKRLKCANGDTCYPLVNDKTNKRLPDNVGICAPAS